MNHRTAEQWIQACKWNSSTPGVPAIVSRMIQKNLQTAMKKVVPYKPKIKFPKGIAPVTIPKLKKELDRVFSLFIRQRDSDFHGNGRCVTCGVFREKSKLQAGHYVPRQFLATRWEPENVHSQCGACNGFRGGEQEKMAAYIDAMYGTRTAEALTVQRRLKFRPTRDWLDVQIKHYKEKINGL